MDERKNLGVFGEDLAEKHFLSLGFSVLFRNFRIRTGEIDLIAAKDCLLSFIEVKTRKTAGPIDPSWLVNRRKQQHIISTAKYFLMTHPEFQEYQCRFDVLTITLDTGEITHYENAFQ